MRPRRRPGARVPAWLPAVLLCLLAAPAAADLVKGTVRDEQGNPIFNADFNVYDAATGEKLAPSDNTDALGKYNLIVNPGVYDLLCQVKDVNQGFAPKIVRDVSVSGTLVLDYVLAPSIQVLGIVTDSRNPDPTTNGVVAADLDFDRVDDGSRQPALGDITGFAGRFRTFLEAGAYNVTVNPDPLTGLAPARMFNVTLPTPDILLFPLVPAVTISGFIRDDTGAPVAGATLKFDDANGREPSTKNASAADGSYQVGVAPGVYRVTVEPKVGTNYAAIRVPDVDLTASLNRDFTVAVGVAVTGLVTNTQGRPVIAGDWDAILEADGVGAATPGDNTGIDGRYRFVVAPGTYRLRFTPPAGSGLDSVVFRNVALSRDTTINVDYAALGGGGGPGASPIVRFSPTANPTHTTAGITLVLASAIQSASIELFDVSGRLVRELHRGAMAAGTHALPWDGRRDNGAQAHTGVFFVRARLDGFERVTRFVLLP